MASDLLQLGKRFRSYVWRQTQRIEPNLLDDGLSVIDTATFLRLNTEQKWLVKRIVVEGQPAIMGGGKKTLKTSLLIALAVAMASRMPFLRTFNVPRALRVGLISGEAGAATIKETFLRICLAMMVEKPEELGIYWGFRLPQLSVLRELNTLSQLIEDNGLEVLILDPLYLCLLAAGTDLQASNLYQVGPLLAEVSRACLEAGATPILAHHTRMGTATSYEPPDLGDLAFAGVQEFARQWLLVGRREKYEPGSGEHRLWLNVGGSAGFSGCWALDLEEGVVRDDFTGRRWDVAVRSSTDERQQKEQERQAEKQREVAQDRAKVATVLRRHPDGETYSKLCEAVDISKKRVRIVLDQMLDAREVEECRVIKPAGRSGTQEYDAFRLVVPQDDEDIAVGAANAEDTDA